MVDNSIVFFSKVYSKDEHHNRHHTQFDQMHWQLYSLHHYYWYIQRSVHMEQDLSVLSMYRDIVE
ncbi:unnamed protein product [Schistosoma margrebowiei]|uniref:Uncharacterized protein n=1 Tax=Schistosoma margrebowiei TaxID=48269 RepID=A0A3P8BCD5_9TREM|nr:unnamed protein product [Schistosoma margrebowiei]